MSKLPKLPNGFELDAEIPEGFELESAKYNSNNLPPGFEYENSSVDEVSKFGMSDSFLKKFGMSGSNAIGDSAKNSVVVSGVPKIGEILGRVLGGETEFNEISPVERSFHSGVSRTFGEAVSQIPSAMYAVPTYIDNFRKSKADLIYDKTPSAKNLPKYAIEKTAKKLGLVEGEYNPKYDKVPDWLVNNPLSQFFGKASETLNYNRRKYGNENAFTLWAKNPEAAVDWTVNAVAENLPYSLFSTALTMAGVPAKGVMTASGILAGLGMLKEEFNNPNLDELEKVHSLFLKASAEGASEYVGAKLFPVASGIFKSLGTKVGKEVLKNSIVKGMSGIAFGVLEEGAEEFATGVAQGAVDMYYKSVDDLTWQKVFQNASLEGYLGAMSGGVYSSGAAMQASLELGNPKVFIDGMDSANKNVVDGIDTRMTLEELMEARRILKAKNEGLERPETGEAMTVPKTLSAKEVELLQRIEDDIKNGNYREVQEDAVKALGDGIAGDILVNMTKESFDDGIREKTAKGEELSENEKAYLEFKRQRTSQVKGADLETAKGMSSEDYLTWANDRAKTSFQTRQELLDAKELHKSLIESGDFETAVRIRKSVSKDTDLGQKTASEMEALEADIQSKVGDEAIQATDQELAMKYKELEELDNLAVGEITEDFEERSKALIEEIKSLEEKKSEQTKYRKDLESRKRGIQVSEPDAEYGKQSKLGFYSAVEKAIEKLPSNFSSEQAINTIRNTPGVKQEEIEWLGLEEYLKEKGKVSKADLLNFIKQNQVEIKQVSYGGITEEQVIERELDRLAKEKYNKPFNDLYDDEQDEVRDIAEAIADRDGPPEGMVKFQNYQLPGGENYREVLLTLPSENTVKSERMTAIEQQIEEAKSFDERNELRTEYNRLATEIRNSTDFQSGHWEEPNVLAHFRLNDRYVTSEETSKDLKQKGMQKKILFIEEIQSDWHQLGREKGYAGKEVGVRDYEVRKENGLYRIYYKGEDSGSTFERIEDADQYLQSAIARKSGGVPNAPFKKTWHELALKRILRMAVEEGYDAIAWTTGEQQAERYDLSKQVEILYYKKNSDGTYDVKATPKNGANDVMVGSSISEGKLADYVGKDISQKIIKGDGVESKYEDGFSFLKGVDLKVGDMGMKGFYDQIIPAFLNKYTKKWGGRVGQATITAEEDVMNGEEADSAKVHSLEITPSMRESVTKGQALFEPKQGYLPGMGEGAKLPSEREVAYGSDAQAELAIEKVIQEIQGKYASQNIRRASIVQALKEKKSVDFSGQKIDSADSLAELHQVFRSPAVETFVYYVTKPDGTIFVNRAISSGHLDQVIIGEEVYDSMFIDLLNAGEGAKLYLAHNHPSGRTVYSQEDMLLTQRVKEYFPRAFKGHVVIDHGKYLLIDENLKTRDGFYQVSAEGKRLDWRSGLKTVNEPDHLAEYFDDVLRSPNSLHIVYLDKGNNIVAYEVKSTKELETDLFQKVKNSLTSFASISYILMGDTKTIQSLIAKGSPYGVLPNKILDIIEISSGGEVTSYVEARKTLPHIQNKGVFEPSENYGRKKKERVTPEFEAKYVEAETFLQEYKNFRKKIGKMRKHLGGFMAEELADIPSFYWSKEETAPFPDDKATEAGYESEDAMFNAIREVEAKKKKYLPFMKEAKEIIAEERVFQREFEKGRRYGYSQGYKEASKVIKEKFASKALSEQEMKDAIVEYASEFLPKDLRGELLAQVRDAKSMLDAFKAFQKIDELADQGQKMRLIDSLKKSLRKVKDAQNLAIEYKEMLLELADSISFTKPRQATLERLQKTKDWIEAEIKAGREVTLPKYVYDGLKVLERISVKDLTLEELEFMIDKVELAIEVGKAKLKARRYLYEADKERILDELQISKPNKFNTTEKLQGVYKQVADYALLLNKARAPMDHFFLSLGDTAHRLFKKDMDSKYANYLQERRSLEERTDALIKKLGLTEKNMERIGIYAADQQEGGREKLLNRFTEKEIEAIRLDKNETEFYAFMRTELEAIRPDYEKVLNEVFNLPLGKVVNYFPFLSDFEAMSDAEIRDRFAHMAEYSPQLKKTVDISSSIPRIDRIGIQKIRIDASNVFAHHMDSVLYAVHMAEEIKKLQEIARSEEYREIVGNIGQEITRQWLDVMARKGGRFQKKNGLERGIDFLRKNLSVSQLAVNPASILLQTTAVMDGAMQIGNYAFIGQPLAYESQWRNFALNNSAQLKNRVGDDFAFREFGKKFWGQFQSKLMTPQKALDGIVATGVWIGAYQKKLDEKKLKMDFNNADKEAVDYANQILTMTQASGSFKDLPVSITRGVAVGGSESFAKALAQFQTFAFFRWANVSDSLYKAMKEKDYKTSAQIGAWWMVANLSELAIRHGVKGVMAMTFLALFGAKGELDDDDKSLLEEIFGSLIGNIPYISNIISVIEYKSSPVAIISAFEQAMDSWEYYQRSKKTGKKIKWATIATLQTAGIAFGAPTGQANRLIKQGVRAMDEKPFERTMDTDGKLKALYGKFKKIRSEVDSQYKAVKENPEAFDETHRSKISRLYGKINGVESRVKSFNQRGSGDSEGIKSALEEIGKIYEN